MLLLIVDAEMFKQKKEKKHLVPWIHRKHKSKSSTASESADAVVGQLTIQVLPHFTFIH